MSNPHRALVAGGSAVALLVVTSSVSAQTFGQAGDFAVGAERLFGVVSSNLDADWEDPVGPVNVNVEYESSTTEISLLGQGAVVSAFAFPRLGFDYFVIDSLSIGGSLTYFHRSTERDTRAGNLTVQDDDSANGLLFAFRAGFAYMFSPVVGIWLRGGFSYASYGEEDDNAANTDIEVDGVALDLEGFLVITPVEHVGFTLGPSLDVTLGAGGEVRTGNVRQDIDAQLLDIGLWAGLFVWF